jgi:hypothetical protein
MARSVDNISAPVKRGKHQQRGGGVRRDAPRLGSAVID